MNRIKSVLAGLACIMVLKDMSRVGMVDHNTENYSVIVLFQQFSPFLFEITYSNKQFMRRDIIKPKDLVAIFPCDDVTVSYKQFRKKIHVNTKGNKETILT